MRAASILAATAPDILRAGAVCAEGSPPQGDAGTCEFVETTEGYTVRWSSPFLQTMGLSGINWKTGAAIVLLGTLIIYAAPVSIPALIGGAGGLAALTESTFGLAVVALGISIIIMDMNGQPTPIATTPEIDIDLVEPLRELVENFSDILEADPPRIEIDGSGNPSVAGEDEAIQLMLNQALPTIPEIPDDWSGDPSRWEESVRNIGKTALTTCLTVVTTETVLNLMPGWGPNLYKNAANACTGISIIVPAGRTNPRSTAKKGSKPIYQATQHMNEAVYGTPAETSQLQFHDSPLEAPNDLVNGPTGNLGWIPLKRWQGRSLGDWYTSGPYYCEPEDRQTNNCDEYPWKATTQGGPTNRELEPQTPLPHLRIINANHNKDSGRELGSFYGRCHVDDNEWFLSIPAPLEEIPLLSGDGLLSDLPFHHLAPTLYLGSSCT